MPCRVAGWPLVAGKDDYLLAFGRVLRGQGLHLAIEVARRTGHRLVMAGIVQDWYRDYFERRILPEIDGDRVVFEAEVSDEASASCSPTPRASSFRSCGPSRSACDVEAMATGTPVIALRNGSVGEVVDDGVTGFVCERTSSRWWPPWRGSARSDPNACRRVVEERFSVAAMTAGYEALYRGCWAEDGRSGGDRRPARPARGSLARRLERPLAARCRATAPPPISRRCCPGSRRGWPWPAPPFRPRAW